MTVSIRSFYKEITILIFLAVLTGCDSNPEERYPEEFIIPDGYIGSFYIIFNVKDGINTENESGRVYKIPENGVLYTENTENTGWIESNKVNFFYSTSEGYLKPISERWKGSVPDTEESRRDNIVRIFGGGIGVYNHPDIPCAVVYQPFYVGTKSDILNSVNQFDLENIEGLSNMQCMSN